MPKATALARPRYAAICSRLVSSQDLIGAQVPAIDQKVCFVIPPKLGVKLRPKLVGEGRPQQFAE